MNTRHANRTTTAAPALAAALTLGFAPAAGPGPQSHSPAGECLEGYAYLEILGDDHGITSTWCIHPTDCDSYLRVGPASSGTSTVKAHYYVNVPRHTGNDVGCYL